MTAKEELKEVIEELTEEQASQWLERVRSGSSGLRMGSLYRLPPEQRAAALQQFFDSWRNEDAYLTDEEWEEFTHDFDAQRPHRPLFT
ncbi:MAG: hypothetical protein WED87_01285 [Dehalococcoidia bacterium]